MSYIRNCRYCGARISMREMPYGQWVAFEAGSDTTHECGAPAVSHPAMTAQHHTAVDHSSPTYEREVIKQRSSPPPKVGDDSKEGTGALLIVILLSVIAYSLYRWAILH